MNWTTREASADLIDSKDTPSSLVYKRMGAGVNISALEAPNEGEWGPALEPEYFSTIKNAGFKNIRLPIKWSNHADRVTPFKIDPTLMSRVEWAIDQALKQSLIVVINMHHYEELESAPQTERQRFLALWKEISNHFRQMPPEVMFELYNEPCKNLNADVWNQLSTEALNVVRETNPNRTVIIGPANWNNIDQLDKLKLPRADHNILVEIHYYEPFHFTHQGASWAEHSDEWLGTKWSGQPAETAKITSDLHRAAIWSADNGVPIYLGEFGSYFKADMPSRLKWTRAVSNAANNEHFSYAYWEFCNGFGVFDHDKKEWKKPLLEAVLDQ